MKRIRTKSSDNYAPKGKKSPPKRKGSLNSVTDSISMSPIEKTLSPIDRTLSPIEKKAPTVTRILSSVENLSNGTRVSKARFTLKLVSHGRIHGPIAEPDEEKEEMLEFTVRDVPAPSAKVRKNYTGLSPRLRREIFTDKTARVKYDTMVIEIEKFMNSMEVGAKWDSAHPGAVDEEAPSTLIVGIQCEEGKHRSVAFVEELSTSVKRDAWAVLVEHRDLDGNEGGDEQHENSEADEEPTMGKKQGIKSVRKKDKNLRRARDKRLMVEVVGSGAEEGFV